MYTVPLPWIPKIITLRLSPIAFDSLSQPEERNSHLFDDTNIRGKQINTVMITKILTSFQPQGFDFCFDFVDFDVECVGRRLLLDLGLRRVDKEMEVFAGGGFLRPIWDAQK